MSNPASHDPWEISPEAVKQRLQQEDDVVLIDCRTPREFEIDHIDGARLMPMQELSIRNEDIEDLERESVIIYCRTGRRSRIVARFMVLRGCTNVVSMAGGIEAWMQDADPAAPAS
jgi:rhodanese-related sulfurtransferase